MKLAVDLTPIEMRVLRALQLSFCEWLLENDPDDERIKRGGEAGRQIEEATDAATTPLLTRPQWMLVLHWITWAVEVRERASDAGADVQEEEPDFLSIVDSARDKIRLRLGAH